jgi:glycosyltransferase involved in cell wall biosynthesis
MMKDILIIGNEITPYMTDLHNALNAEDEIKITVFYPFRRNWAKDGGHRYNVFPERKYQYIVGNGYSFIDTLNNVITLMKLCFNKYDYWILYGYNDIIHFLALLFSMFKRQKIMLYTDHFNNGVPKTGGILAPYIKPFVRKILKNKLEYVLVCGKIGIETATEAGFAASKIINYPYVIDGERMMELSKHSDLEKSCWCLNKNKVNILFSGRLIERKGLDVLLKAFYYLDVILKDNSHLIIEGEGPCEMEYKKIISDLNIASYCTFTGFNQMDTHAYLVSISDIIVIPSKEDPWGIVVQEGMLFKKPVCASNKVGSALERIKNEENGYIFENNNCEELAELLKKLIISETLRNNVGKKAYETALLWTPNYNSSKLAELVNESK